MFLIKHSFEKTLFRPRNLPQTKKLYQTRSKQIKRDQRGSRQIKGDQCDFWVGVSGVGVGVGDFHADQSRSRQIKGDQGRSKEINVICG